MSGIAFTTPARLWCLLVVVALGAAHVVLQRRRSRFAVRLPGLSLLAQVAPRLGWRKHVASALALLAMGGATAAFAEPTAEVQVPRERATVVVALDVSSSMAATDVAPDRFTAAQAAAVAFVEGLPERFNVGLVAFSGSARVVVPATQEHTAVTAAIERLTMDKGTAIGEAVYASLDAVAAVPGATATTDRTPAHVVLLSDGTNTVGRSTASAVEQAVAAGVPVSTIAYGTQQGEVQIDRERISVPVDTAALTALAQDAGGTAYEAASGDELEQVYADIGSAVGTTSERREIGGAVAGLALLAAVGAGAAAAAWSPRGL